MTLTVSAARDRLTSTSASRRWTLRPGGWSDWVSLPFRVNPLITVHGYAPLPRSRSVQPEIALYLSPIQFDPERLPPGFALSSPAGFAQELVRALRPLQDDGLGDRHVVHPVGTLDEDGVPRGRRRDGRAGAEDARGAARGEAAPARPVLRVPRPRRARLLAAARPEAPGLRRRARRAVRRRGREVLRDDGRDRGRRRRRRSRPRTS